MVLTGAISNRLIRDSTDFYSQKIDSTHSSISIPACRKQSFRGDQRIVCGVWCNYLSKQ